MYLRHIRVSKVTMYVKKTKEWTLVLWDTVVHFLVIVGPWCQHQALYSLLTARTTVIMTFLVSGARQNQGQGQTLQLPIHSQWCTTDNDLILSELSPTHPSLVPNMGPNIVIMAGTVHQENGPYHWLIHPVNHTVYQSSQCQTTIVEVHSPPHSMDITRTCTMRCCHLEYWKRTIMWCHLVTTEHNIRQTLVEKRCTICICHLVFLMDITKTIGLTIVMWHMNSTIPVSCTKHRHTQCRCL